MKKKLKLFAQIAKIDEARRQVWGVATSELVDKDGEIFDYQTSKPYFRAWSDEIAKATGGRSLGNVREMHEPSAVGKLVEIGFDDGRKEVRVAAKIVDDEAWRKCIQGVYTGFSIGGTYVNTWKEGEYTRYTARPVEISVVDNPCNPGAHFTAVKADGTLEMRKFASQSPSPGDARKGRADRGPADGGAKKGEGANQLMEKIGAKHSAETRAHHEALDDCMTKIAQACGAAQDHVDALLGKDDKDDKDETAAAARPAFGKQHSTGFQANAESEQRVHGQDGRDESKARGVVEPAAASPPAIAKVAELEHAVAGLRAEIKSDLADLGQALANLAAAIDKLNGESTHKAARAAVPAVTITKEDDNSGAARRKESGKDVHELLKQTLKNPQRASHYLR